MPTLHPGDLVILDNLAVHQDPVSAQSIEQAGAPLVFLLPYSPDLNPIEPVFAKLKALARGAATRSREALEDYLGTAVSRFSPQKRGLKGIYRAWSMQSERAAGSETGHLFSN